MGDQLRYAGRFLHFIERQGWEFVTRPTGADVVAVAAMTEAQEVVLIEQARLPLGTAGQRVIEIPAGLVGDTQGDDDPIAAAERELAEEAGFQARHYKLLTRGPCAAGLSDETVNFVLAEGLQRCGPGGGIDGENITVHLVLLTEVDAWLEEQSAGGKLIDPKVWAALYLLHRSRPRAV